MEIDIVHNPGNAAARLRLAPGERCVTEGGAMIAMSGDTRIETSTHSRGGGGVLKALKRMVAGESAFLNHYTAGAGGGEVWVAATLAGDMLVRDLNQETLIAQSGAFVACEEGVDITVGWQGFKNMFSGESMFWVHLKGSGRVVLASFGAIYPIEVRGETLVDTGHIVAFEETLEFDLTKAGKSWVSSILGGEGLVCRFKGRGTVWCQSHNPVAFGRTLGPMLKAR